MTGVGEARDYNSTKRRVRRIIRWLRHLGYTLYLLSTKQADKDGSARRKDVERLKNNEESSSCECKLSSVSTSASEFAEQTWKHIRHCVLGSVQ
jgi:hypothetical protein